MSSRESSKAESVKKRARESASIDVNKRTKDLVSKKLFSLHNEFPEVKYIARSTKFLKHAVKMNRDTMIENVEEKEIHEEEESAPLYSLPDELVSNCLSFLGEGHYGLVGLVSKKLNQAYKADFGQETTYNEMATSVKLVNYCLKEFGKTHQDDLFKAAAVNGNLAVLRALVKVGYNLSLLIRMEKKTLYGDDDGKWLTSDDFEPYITECCFDKKEDIYYTDDEGVDLSQIVARGHLHVLKYLHEKLNCHEGLEKYVQPAIQYGNVEILEWLRDIGCMNSDHKMFTFYHEPREHIFWRFAFCDEAVRCGNVQSLGWLLDHEYEFSEYFPVILNAVRSKSTEMIRFCFEKGYGSDYDDCNHAITESEDIEVYHLFHELGFEFKGDIGDWVGHYRTHDIANNFDILKFLRSISVPWNNKIMAVIVEHGTLEMIRHAHEDGCPWTPHGDECYPLLRGLNQSMDGKMVKVDYIEKWKYLINNGCTFNYGHRNLWTINKDLKEFLTSKKDLVLLQFFVGKDPSFDDELFRYFLMKASSGELWFEGIFHIVENGKNSSKIFRSIEEVSQHYFNFHIATYGWTQQTLFDLMRSKKDFGLLEHFVGKNSRFDNELFKYFLDERFGELWFEGIFYLLKNGKDD